MDDGRRDGFLLFGLRRRCHDGLRFGTDDFLLLLRLRLGLHGLVVLLQWFAFTGFERSEDMDEKFLPVISPEIVKRAANAER